jgi:hypothetical protein
MASTKIKSEERVSDQNQNQNQRLGKQQHTRAAKIGVSIESQQEDNRSTEVIAFPPSFNYWKENFVLGSLSKT